MALKKLFLKFHYKTNQPTNQPTNLGWSRHWATSARKPEDTSDKDSEATVAKWLVIGGDRPP